MSLTDYSDLEKEIADTPEAHTLARGSEVKLRIIAVQTGEGDYGIWHRVSFDIPADPLALELSDFFADPLSAKQSGDEKRKVKAFRKFRNFAESFGLDYSRPFSWDADLVSLEGWAILGIKKSDEFGEQNTVSKYVVGKPKSKSEVTDDDIPF